MMIPAIGYFATIILLFKTVTGLPLSSADPVPYYGNRYDKERYGSKDTPANSRPKPRIPDPWRTWKRRQVSDYYNATDGKSMSSKNGMKRGVNIGIHVNLPTTPKYKNDNNNLNKLEEKLEKALEGMEEVLNSTPCPKCEEEEEEAGLPGSPLGRRLKPAYKCDDWDAKMRICILERNIGDTVTFYLSTGTHNGEKLNVIWKKEFHMQDTKTRTEYVIEPDNSPQNIIIGKQGYELRVSPITEIDIGNNLFSATLHGHTSHSSKLYFIVRIVPIDLGFVYVGESIELNLRSYASLPPESLNFRWYMEKYGEHGTLPSNMRTSSTGSSIKISELRQEQEGILACSVYTNLNFLATKKRFLIKDLQKNKDVLESAPNHNLTFTEEQPDKKKRNSKKIIPNGRVTSKRTKRAIDVSDLVEKALVRSTTTSGRIDRDAMTHSFTDYDLDMDIEADGSRSKSFENIPENPDDIDNPDLSEADLQRSNQYEESLDTNPVEVADGGKNGVYSSQVQNTNSRLLPQMETSMMISQQDKKIPNRYSAYEETIPENTYPRKQEAVGQQNSAFANLESGRKYADIDGEDKKEDLEMQTKESEIILNIESIPGPKRMSAEESISQLISSCYTDFQCSGIATCVRSSLKQKGYCKCLSGFYGVGIFCRESIWLSNGNFDIEMHNQDAYLNGA